MQNLHPEKMSGWCSINGYFELQVRLVSGSIISDTSSKVQRSAVLIPLRFRNNGNCDNVAPKDNSQT